MPSMPASFSASFTASNREVWMIASIFVIVAPGSTDPPRRVCAFCQQRHLQHQATSQSAQTFILQGSQEWLRHLGLQVVALLAVLRNVESFRLVLLIHAHAHG